MTYIRFQVYTEYSYPYSSDTSLQLDNAERGTITTYSEPPWTLARSTADLDLGSDKENENMGPVATDQEPLAMGDEDITMAEQVGGGDGSHPYNLRRHLSITPNATKISHVAASTRLHTMEPANPIYPLRFPSATLINKEIPALEATPLSPQVADSSPTPQGSKDITRRDALLGATDMFDAFLSIGSFQPLQLPPAPLVPDVTHIVTAEQETADNHPAVIHPQDNNDIQVDSDLDDLPSPPGCTPTRGRIPTADLEVLEEFFARVDDLFKEASMTVKRPISIDAIIARWSDTRGRKRGTNLWNTYQNYFAANPDQEMSRVTDGSEATGIFSVIAVFQILIQFDGTSGKVLQKIRRTRHRHLHGPPQYMDGIATHRPDYSRRKGHRIQKFCEGP